MFKQIKFNGTESGPHLQLSYMAWRNMQESTLCGKVPEGECHSAGTARDQTGIPCKTGQRAQLLCMQPLNKTNNPGSNTAQVELP